MSSDSRFLPVCEPVLAGNEVAYVREAVESGWISSSGRFVDEFEQAFAEYLGVKYAIGVINGTAALHLALVGLGIGPGDEVVVPSFTMAATGFAVAYTGATPVFVDVDEQTWNMDVAAFERAITHRTRAVIPVHVFGTPCDMRALMAVAESRGIEVLEDAAEAHGATFEGEKVGTFGACSAFSFYANKNLTTGEGGMVTTDDPELASRFRYLKNMCFPLNQLREYRHDEVGFNYRLSNLHAAIGLAQVEKADEYRDARVEVGRRYREILMDDERLVFQAVDPRASSVYWMNAIVLSDDVAISVECMQQRLGKHGIDSRRLFRGLHSQSCFEDNRRLASDAFPNTERLSERGLYLPSGSALSSLDVARVCAAVQETLNDAGR
jgi:perosamine synthetase